MPPRPTLDRLLAPQTVAVFGAHTSDGARVLANLGDYPRPAPGEAPDFAVIASTGAQAERDLAALAALGGRAAVVTGPVAGLAQRARTVNVRVLGPVAFGVAVSRLGLNASLSHMAVPPGHIALVTQSASLARAVVDWAGPNGVGFSHVIGLGGAADVGFGAVLDVLARDPDTRLVLLDIRRVQDRRAFISAARAASRLRPVVALRPGGLLLDPTGQADAVFAAALNRAGVFTVDTLEAFLAAAETLSRARPLQGETMAVVTNAIGPGRLAADAALRAGIRLAILPPEAQQTLTASLPADLLLGLVYAGSAAPTDVASIAAMVGAVPGVGGVLVLLSPTGPGDFAAIGSAIAAAQTARLPVLTCVMGETTGAAHRKRLAEAGLPAFATPEQAVAAFGHLLRNRTARQAARELPPGRVLDVDPDTATAAILVGNARAEGRVDLTAGEAAALLACYGLHGGAASARSGGADGAGADRPAGTLPACVLSVHDDPTFGPAIGLAVLPQGTAAYDLPPLNLPLAEALARRAGLDGQASAAAAGALVRVSQLLVDEAQLARLLIDRLKFHAPACMGDSACSCTADGVSVKLRPPGERAALAISPYPEQLAHPWHSHGQDFLIRPIRPEDAAAHAEMVRRVPPEDLRYRFFSAVRQVAPEQMVRLTQIDYDREMALIAVRLADMATVGVARLVCETEGGPGEFALLVEPDCKGLGLARHLMDSLVLWARSQSLPAITGQVLADNHVMLGFVRHYGFTLEHLPGESDVVGAVLQLTVAKPGQQ